MDGINDMSYLSRRNKLIITDPRPDLRISDQNIMFGGTQQIELALMIENLSDSTLSQISVDFFVDSLGSGQELFHSEQINLNAQEKRPVSVVIDQALIQSELTFIAAIDRENTIEERNEENNIKSIIFPANLFNIPQTIGTTYDGVNNDTLNLNMLYVITYCLRASQFRLSFLSKVRQIMIFFRWKNSRV